MQHIIRHTSCVAVLLLAASPVWAQLAAGSGAGAPAPIQVDFNSLDIHWELTQPIIFDPSAPGMEKTFDSPKDVTGAPIHLDALQPFPIPVWENFPLIGGPPVADWHEEIVTPGWVWSIPDPFGLITLNGVPWPSAVSPLSTPTMLWVDFDPIPTDPTGGTVLDIHKELLWEGTPGNRIWGDGVDDIGNVVDESGIIVLEHPTPEPTSLVLLSLGTLAMLRRR